MTKQATLPATHSDPLLTAAEAATQLDVTPGTLAVWRCTQRYLEDLPYVKVGSKVRYRQSAVTRFLERRTVCLHEA